MRLKSGSTHPDFMYCTIVHMVIREDYPLVFLTSSSIFYVTPVYSLLLHWFITLYNDASKSATLAKPLPNVLTEDG